MRLSILRQTCGVATLAVVGLLCMAQPARATFELILSDGISADTQTFTDIGTTTVAGFIALPTLGATVGNFNISGTAHAPPFPAQTFPNKLIATQNTFDVVATDGGGTLTITLVDTGLSLPGSTLNMESAIGSSQFTNASGTSTYSFQSWLDPNNFAGSVLGGTTAGVQGTFNSAPVGAPNGGQPADVFISAANPGTFAIENQLTYVGAGGDSLSVTGTTTITSPAPSTAVFALTGLPLLSLGLWMRRRMTRKAPVAA